METARELIARPWALATLGAATLLVVVLVLSNGGDDGPTLDEPRVEANGEPTPTAVATTPRTATATDADDEVADSRRGLTDTVGDDLSTERVGFLAFDPDEECLWLVDVEGGNPADLHVIAWPTGTELAWTPVEVRVRSATGGTVTITPADRVLFRGRIIESGLLEPSERLRLLDQERCGHDAVVVIDDDPTAVRPASE